MSNCLCFRKELVSAQLRLRPVSNPRFRFDPPVLTLSREHLSGRLEVVFLAALKATGESRAVRCYSSPDSETNSLPC